MAARLEAMGLNGVRTHFSLEGTLPWILAEGQDPETGYCVALCFTPCAIGVYAGNGTVDVTQIPVSGYENYLRSPELGVYEQTDWLIRSDRLQSRRSGLLCLARARCRVDRRHGRV